MKITNVQQFIFGAIIGAALVIIGLHVMDKKVDEETQLQQELAAYYANETAALVSSHSIREKMSHGTDGGIVLVDVRTEEDYLREHIVTAVNIDTGRPLDQVLADFQQLEADNPGKDIIIYCYSAACMNGRKAGNFLAENGVFVKEMTIGWNEWRYDWEMWNYDTEWDEYKVEDYVVNGPEPGEVPEHAKSVKPCPIDGALSC